MVDWVDSFEHEALASDTGAAFCPWTSFVYLPIPCPPKEQLNEFIKHYPFIHEQFHWFTSVATGAGFFISNVRCARTKALQTYLCLESGSHVDEYLASYGTCPPLLPRVPLPEVDRVLDPYNSTVSPTLFNQTILKLFDRQFLKPSKTFGMTESLAADPRNTMLATFRHVSKYFEHRYSLPSSWDGRSDSEINERAEDFNSEFFMARSPQHKRLIDTYDLLETYSVVADTSAGYFLGNAAHAEERIENLKGDDYFIVIETIFDSFGLPLTAENIAEYSPMINCIVEAALSADYPPLHDFFGCDMTWADYHPSARLVKIVIKAASLGRLRYPVEERQVNEYFLELLSACRSPSRCVYFKPPANFIDELRAFEKEVIAEATPQTNTYKGQADKFALYDFYLLAYVNFRSLCVSSGMAGITSLFHSHKLHDFPYSAPPVTVFNDGSTANAHYFPATVLPNLYLSFSIYYGIDSVIFTPAKRRVFPFAVSPDIDDEDDWGGRKWRELFDALKRMRAEHV